MVRYQESTPTPRLHVRLFRACNRKRAIWKSFRVDRRVGGDPVNGVDSEGRWRIGLGAAADLDAGIPFVNVNASHVLNDDGSRTWTGTVGGDIRVKTTFWSGKQNLHGDLYPQGTTRSVDVISRTGSSFRMHLHTPDGTFVRAS